MAMNMCNNVWCTKYFFFLYFKSGAKKLWEQKQLVKVKCVFFYAGTLCYLFIGTYNDQRLKSVYRMAIASKVREHNYGHLYAATL
jgi:hypothetical protein